MALLFVNAAPNKDPSPIGPTFPISIGARDTTGTVSIGKITSSMGRSKYINSGVLPDSDLELARLNAKVSIETVEHLRPITGASGLLATSGNLQFTKLSNLEGEQSIYEVKVPIETAASILGYFKIKVDTSWQQFSPDWINPAMTNMTGVYLSLEHGTWNNSCNVFLRNNGSGGSIVIGGPLQAFNTARPGQHEYAFNWLSMPAGSTLEFWIFYNGIGLPSPFSAPYLPVVELWVKRSTDAEATIVAQVPTLSLGEFQSDGSSSSNFRDGTSDFATISFGNAGRSGDVLVLEDWAIFPDYRVSVIEGHATENHSLTIAPDAPTSYVAAKGFLPKESPIGRWFDSSDGIAPNAVLKYQPGRKLTPQSVSIPKDSAGVLAYERDEPRVGTRVDGFMIEAFMGADSGSIITDAFGAGISVEDGLQLFRLVFLETPTIRSIGLSSDLLQTYLLSGYHCPLAEDGVSPLYVEWRGLQMYRITVDRLRSKVYLDLNESRLLSLPLNPSGTFNFPTSSNARASFGFLLNEEASGTAYFSLVNFLPRYKAWEVEDQLLPTASVVPFTLTSLGDGSSALDPATPNATELVIGKGAPGFATTCRYYTRSEDFDYTKGILVDFSAKVHTYWNTLGEQFYSSQWVGSGIAIFLGSQKLHLGFFNCGVHGFKIGIIPGTGEVSDIVNQTALGRSFSADATWLEFHKYRVIYKAFDSIKVWVDDLSGAPVITIPWRGDSFDLPYNTTTSSIAFGHFDDLSASTTAWQYVRWGQSNGYDVSIEQQYPNGLPSYLFGGKLLTKTECSE